MLSRAVRPPHPVDLRLTVGRLGRGPCGRWIGADRWWATRTGTGPATVRFGADGDAVLVSAWGPGAEELVSRAPELVGATDDPQGLVARDAVVAQAQHRLRGLCFVRPRNVVETLIPVILEQKVQLASARAAYGRLVRRWAEPAPGPRGTGLLLPPDPSLLARTPSYVLHPMNVERKRADTVVRAARVAPRLEEAATMGPAEARARLEVLQGVGAWTSAEVAMHALGDPDAVPVGDYHLPNIVSWALAGEARGDDARMLELLEPYRGHRGRVIRLLVASGHRAPKFGPRMERYSIAHL